MLFKRKKRNDDSLRTTRKRDSDAYTKNAVFSYHANRNANSSVGRSLENVPSEENSKRIPKHNYKSLFISTLIFGIVIIGIGMNLKLSSSPKIVVLGNSSKAFLRSNQTYTDAAEQLFSDSVINDNKATVNTSYIAEKLREEFPELAAVSITLPVIGSQPIVYLLPSAPQLVLLDSDGQSLVLDSSGTVLLDASDEAGLSNINVPTVNDQGIASARVGQLVLPTTSVAFVSEVSEQLQEAQVNVTSYNIPIGTSELDASVAGQPYLVKFNLYGNAREEAGTYLAVRQQLQSENKTPSKYIDVRVDGRAYYL